MSAWFLYYGTWGKCHSEMEVTVVWPQKKKKKKNFKSIPNGT